MTCSLKSFFKFYNIGKFETLETIIWRISIEKKQNISNTASAVLKFISPTFHHLPK